jgi:ribonuclease HII
MPARKRSVASAPDFSHEQHFGGTVCGIDEAGRGPWAGPVVAAAAILDAHNLPRGINDSKKLSAAKRDALYEQIIASTRYGVGIASVEEIDHMNILEATKLAMQRAYDALGEPQPTTALIDGNKAPLLPCYAHTIVGGDAKCLSIAAASIIAKVTRDRMMHELAQTFPHYGWEKNAGYGTKYHQDALKKWGVTPHHRQSYAPIRALLEQAA